MQKNMTRDVSQFRSFNVGLARVACLPTELLINLGELEGKDLDSFLKTLLNDKHVAESIFLASPGLYGRLHSWANGARKYRDIDLAFVRYLKRMAERATPFGTFVSVGTFNFSNENTGLRLPPLSEMRIDLRLNASAIMDLIRENVLVESMSARLKYYLNDTLYISNDSCRFVAHEETGGGDTRIYKLVEVERSPELDAIVKIARNGVRIDEICEKFVSLQTTDAGSSEIKEYILSLIDSQILVTDQLIVLSEGDILGSLIDRLREQGLESHRIKDVAAELKSLSALGPGLDIAEYESYSKRHFGSDRNVAGRQLFQADLHVSGENIGTIPDAVKAKIERVLSCLAIASEPVPWNMSEFAASFVDRYGDGEVLLMDLLDEERGLGFGRVDARNSSLVKKVFVNSGRAHRVNDNGKSALYSALFEREGLSEQRYVKVSSEEYLKMLPVDHARHDRHQFMLAWCALWNDGSSSEQKLVPEIRGITLQDPCRILGRFSTGNTQVRALMREIRNREYASNLLPVEIIHLPQSKSGNLTARYADACAVVTIRTGAPSNVRQIPVSDIMVSVIGRRVVLRSVSLNKQLDMRMSNAHNTSKSANLNIYRFLNAVSCQNSGRLSFLTRKQFPGKRYIPGLQIDGVIVSRPTWCVRPNEVEKLRKGDDSERIALIRQWQSKMKLPEWCCLIEGETELPFNLSRDWMVRDLAEELTSRGEGVLTEVYPNGFRPAVHSNVGAHKHELLIALENRMYAEKNLPVVKTRFASASRLSIKDGWLYFKIYCSPALQDEVLKKLVNRVEHQNERASVVGMFFVRYNDSHGHHLRVRFKGHPEALTRVLFPALNDFLEQCLSLGDIFDFAVTTYDREMLRYGGEAGCAICERIFMVDSNAYLKLLKCNTQLESWELAARAADHLLSALGVGSTTEKLNFARRAAENFAIEMKFTSEHRKNIGKIYKEKPYLIVDDSNSLLGKPKDILESCTKATAILWSEFMDEVGVELSEKEVYDIRWSLIHMRFNRFLKIQHRKQESIIWDLLRRSYESQIARVCQS